MAPKRERNLLKIKNKIRIINCVVEENENVKKVTQEF